jgi:hypothetical protein
VFVGAPGSRHPVEAPPLVVAQPAAGCPNEITLLRQAGFALHGRTTAETSGQRRRVFARMVKGDAFAFETSVDVQPDGRFEFRGLPAGRYMFEAGANGWTYDVDEDGDMSSRIQWPTQNTADDSLEANETSVRYEMERLRDAQLAYSKQYGRGFASTLTMLGPPPEWYHTTYERAGLIRVQSDDGDTQIVRYGYRITYHPGSTGKEGTISACTLSARPLNYSKTQGRSFLLDEQGTVHATAENRAATKYDPVVKE